MEGLDHASEDSVVGRHRSSRLSASEPILLGLLLTLVVALPRLLLGSGSYVTLHDNLDAEIAQRVLLARDHIALDYGARLPEILNGLPRALLPSGLSFTLALYELLPPLGAYAVNEAFVHAVAFAGMYLFSSRYLETGEGPKRVSLVAAALFALLPFYSTYCLSIAGHPLVAYAFANLASGRRRWPSLLVVTAFPLFSIFATSTVFVIAVAGAAWLVCASRSRKAHGWMAAGVAAMAAVGFLVEYPLIHAALFGSGALVPHRAAWNDHTIGLDSSAVAAARAAVSLFFFGKYHAASLHTPIVAAVVLGVIAAARSGDDQKTRLLLLLMLLAALAAASYGIFTWKGLWPLRKAVHGLGTLNVRLFFFVPLIWYVALAVSLSALWRFPWGRRVAAAFACFQAAWIVAAPREAEPELRTNYGLLVNRAAGRPSRVVTYEKFLAERQFHDIAERIGEPLDRVHTIAVGIHPGVLQMNGFFTLDGYASAYPLTYKLAFRKIIAPELAKNGALRSYFDDWGSRCYVFAARYGTKHLNEDLHDRDLRLDAFAIDVDALRALGGTHVLSAYEITDQSFLARTHFLGKFSEPPTARDVYVYEVK